MSKKISNLFSFTQSVNRMSSTIKQRAVLFWKGFIVAGMLTFFSQQSYPQSLSLPDAINIALKNSLDLQLLKNNVEIAVTNNNIGVAGGLPLVTAGASDNQQVTNVNQTLNTGTNIKRDAATGNNLAANVSAGMLLYNGSRVVATKHRLEELESQNEKYLNAQVQNTMAQVMTAYYDVIRQQAYINSGYGQQRRFVPEPARSECTVAIKRITVIGNRPGKNRAFTLVKSET